MTKKQFDITDPRDLCHTKQVTAEHHSAFQSSEVSVSGNRSPRQRWQLVSEPRREHTCQQLPVTDARQLISLLRDLTDFPEFTGFWPSVLIFKNLQASSEFSYIQLLQDIGSVP